MTPGTGIFHSQKNVSHIDLKLSIPENYTTCIIEITDNAYKRESISKKVVSGNSELIPMNLKKSYSWCDFTVRIRGNREFIRRFAGHVETGESSFTDPLMRRVGV